MFYQYIFKNFKKIIVIFIYINGWIINKVIINWSPNPLWSYIFNNKNLLLLSKKSNQVKITIEQLLNI